MASSLADQLHGAFPQGLQEKAPLARYTAARIGGPADFLLTIRSATELENAATTLWELECEFRILGAGSNVLVSDNGVPGVVMLNQAKLVRFGAGKVWAESGAAIGTIARRAGENGKSGLEWAATIPGSVGGAIVGNAGAHGGDTASSLAYAEILERQGAREIWPTERLEFGYRTSWLKRNSGRAVVLTGEFNLVDDEPAAVKARVEENVEYRQRTQPTGASIGSMFANPPGDHAGRLLEAAGLKGEMRGAAEISDQHANFFINRGGATAADVYALIQFARERVAQDSGVELELEIELVGDWETNA